MSGLKHGDQHEYFLLNMPMGYDGTGIKHFEPEFRAGSGETEGYQGDFCPGFGGSYLLVLGTWCCRLLWDEEWHGGWGPSRWFFRVTWLGCVTCGISRLWHKGKFGKRPHFLTSPNYWECQEYIISKYFFFQVMFKIHPTRDTSATPAGEPQLLLHREPRPTCGRGGNRSDGLYGMVIMAHDLGWFIPQTVYC